MENEIIARVRNTGKYSNLRMVWFIFSLWPLALSFFLFLSLSRNRFLTLLKTRPSQIHLPTRRCEQPIRSLIGNHSHRYLNFLIQHECDSRYLLYKTNSINSHYSSFLRGRKYLLV